MRVPRRCRRRLLLPPGWVALGFLLLLGCQALQPWRGQLRLWNMLQVTMPPLKPVDGMPWNHVVYRSPLQLNHFRGWHEVKLAGQLLPDFLSFNQLEAAIRVVQLDTLHAGGVRVRFGPQATYANLVQVLDCMLYTGQRKYWWDIRSKHTVFYAITEKWVPPTPSSRPLLFICGTRNATFHLEDSPTEPAWWTAMKELSQPVWRGTLFGWMLLAGLSFRRIVSLQKFHS